MGCGSSQSAKTANTDKHSQERPQQQQEQEQQQQQQQQQQKKQQQDQPVAQQKEKDTSKASGKANFTQFQLEALDGHNKRREWHHAPPLELSEELNAIAQRWADYLAKEGKFEHSPKEKRNGAGENLAGHSNLISGDDVTEMWYSEIKDYDFSSPGFAQDTGHFTQVVWKDCTHLGIAQSAQKGSSGMYIYVANYRPHGNMIGQFETNVLPKS